MPRERPPLDPAVVVVVFAVTLLSSVLLRGAGLDWWQRVGIQVVIVLAALLAWGRWRRGR